MLLKIFCSCTPVEKKSKTGEEEERPRFTQPGSIVRIKFVNFMQYSQTEFQCGPNLNVIIG